MKKNVGITALTLFLIAALAGVSQAGWPFSQHVDEEGSGKKATEERELGQFERISLSGSADLEIKIGPTQKVTVITDHNLLDNIVTTIKGRHTLDIDSRGSYSTHIGVKIQIEVPKLSYISVSGSGDIRAEGLDQESLEISVSGSGDIRLEGKTDELEIDIDGSGDVDARRLRAKEAYVTINGSGDVKVFASEMFDGAVNGSGDIDVYGNPDSRSRSVRGSGDISMR